VRATIEGQADIAWVEGTMAEPVAADIFTSERAEMEQLLQALHT